MDIQLEKKKGIQKKHLPYIGGGVVILLLLGWIIFGNHASTLKVDGKSLNIADVTYGKFNDYIRVNGQVQPISVVQLSPEEGGIVHADGTPNTTQITASNYYGNLLPEDFLYDASFIKLKELSLGYSFPSKMLKKTPLTALNVSFVARNLCYLLKHTPGTSPEGGYDTTMFSQAIDYAALPYTRTFGLSVSLGF